MKIGRPSNGIARLPVGPRGCHAFGIDTLGVTGSTREGHRGSSNARGIPRWPMACQVSQQYPRTRIGKRRCCGWKRRASLGRRVPSGPMGPFLAWLRNRFQASRPKAAAAAELTAPVCRWDACWAGRTEAFGRGLLAQLDQRTALPDQCLHSAEADVRPPRRKAGFDAKATSAACATKCLSVAPDVTDERTPALNGKATRITPSGTTSKAASAPRKADLE